MFFVEHQQIVIALGVLLNKFLLTYFACDRKSESKSYLKFIQTVSAIVVTDHHSPK